MIPTEVADPIYDVGQEGAQRRAMRVYLDTLKAPTVRRGVTEAVLRDRLDRIESALEASELDSRQRLQLFHQQALLRRELSDSGVSDEEAEAAFVAVAADYGAAKGISWQAWREVGVPVSVLKAAGIASSEVPHEVETGAVGID